MLLLYRVDYRSDPVFRKDLCYGNNNPRPGSLILTIIPVQIRLRLSTVDGLIAEPSERQSEIFPESRRDSLR